MACQAVVAKQCYRSWLMAMAQQADWCLVELSQLGTPNLTWLGRPKPNALCDVIIVVAVSRVMWTESRTFQREVWLSRQSMKRATGLPPHPSSLGSDFRNRFHVRQRYCLAHACCPADMTAEVFGSSLSVCTQCSARLLHTVEKITSRNSQTKPKRCPPKVKHIQVTL